MHAFHWARERARFRSTLAASFVVGLVTTRAYALDGEVTSDTSAQFYDLRSPTGEAILSRRRLTTTVGVGAYDLLGKERGVGQEHEPDLVFRARLRYDSDYGAAPNEASSASLDRLVPGFSRGPVDLMYAYVEGRRFLHGVLGFRVGRQLTTDALGWWAFDGARVTVNTPAYVTLEGYGGMEVRGGLPFSGAMGRWERDGVWRGDRSGYDASTYSSFQQAEIAPAFGAAIEASGVSWLQARLSYRRVYNTGDSIITQFAPSDTTPVTFGGARLSSERIGYALSATASKVGSIQGGLAYDVYSSHFSNLYATADVYAGKKLTLSVDYDYYRPTFDADSIFNFFAAEPTSDIGARALFDATKRWAFSGGAHVRTLQNQTADHIEGTTNTVPQQPTLAIYPSNGVEFDEGGNLGARFKRADTTLGLRAVGNWGRGGDRMGADISGERVIEGRFVLTGRVGAWQWDDKLRPDRSATNIGYVAGVGYRFAPRSQASFDFQHDINRLAGHRFRAMLWLTVAVFR